jgi:hypothetical protein
MIWHGGMGDPTWPVAGHAKGRCPRIRCPPRRFWCSSTPCPIRTRSTVASIGFTVAVCAVLNGAESWVDVAAYGRAKGDWLRDFLALPNGIPSDDTFGRVFSLPDPVALEAWVRATVPEVAGSADPTVGAVDGKKLRRSHNRSRGQAALHLVSALAMDRRVALGPSL